jgi:hypothetical protein
MRSSTSWEDVIVRKERRTPDAAAAVTAAVREFFYDSQVARAEYEHLIDEMPGTDADDHEHMAAAVARQPCTILTHDRRDFPGEPLSERGVTVTDPDSYLCQLADELPDDVTDALVQLAGEKRRPPKTPLDLLEDLERAGVPRFADAIRAVLAGRDE